MTRRLTRQGYWRRNVALIALLTAVWFVATFVTAFYARELAFIDFFGWPLPFYMAAQGTLLVYLAIVWLYARWMRRLDTAHPSSGDEERGA